MSYDHISGYLVSVPMSWRSDQVLCARQLERSIDTFISDGCDGLYLFGTSGEGYAVSNDEFENIVDIFAEATRDFSEHRQVGCFGPTSEQIISRCKIAFDRGIESVQIALPHWHPLSDNELGSFFDSVCGTFRDKPIILYNSPRSKRPLTGRELESIYRRNSNFCGAKTTAGSWMDFYELISEAPSIQHFVTEAAFLFCYGLGRVGLIPSSNYSNPKKSREYYEAVVGNDVILARKLHVEIMQFFYDTARPLVKKGYIDGAIDKAYARIRGLEIDLTMRSPYMPLNEADFAWLENEISQSVFVNSK